MPLKRLRAEIKDSRENKASRLERSTNSEGNLFAQTYRGVVPPEQRAKNQIEFWRGKLSEGQEKLKAIQGTVRGVEEIANWKINDHLKNLQNSWVKENPGLPIDAGLTHLLNNLSEMYPGLPHANPDLLKEAKIKNLLRGDAKLTHLLNNLSEMYPGLPYKYRNLALPKDAKLTDVLKDVEIIDLLKNAGIVSSIKDVKLVDPTKYDKLTDMLKYDKLTDLLEDAELTDLLKDVKLADLHILREKYSRLPHNPPDLPKDAKLTDLLKNAELTDLLKNAKLTDLLKDKELSELKNGVEIVNILKYEELTDLLGYARLTDIRNTMSREDPGFARYVNRDTDYGNNWRPKYSPQPGLDIRYAGPDWREAYKSYSIYRMTNILERIIIETKKKLSELGEANEEAGITRIFDNSPTMLSIADRESLRETIEKAEEKASIGVMKRFQREFKEQKEPWKELNKEQGVVLHDAMVNSDKIMHSIVQTEKMLEDATEIYKYLEQKKPAHAFFKEKEMSPTEANIESIPKGKLPGSSLVTVLRTLIKAQGSTVPVEENTTEPMELDREENFSESMDIDEEEHITEKNHIDEEEYIAKKVRLSPYGDIIDTRKLLDATLSDLGDRSGLQLQRIKPDDLDKVLRNRPSGNPIAAVLDNANYVKRPYLRLQQFVALDRIDVDTDTQQRWVVVLDEARGKPYKVSFEKFTQAWTGDVIIPGNEFGAI